MLKAYKASLILCLVIGLLNCNIVQASEDSHEAKNFIGIFAGVLDADESEALFGIEYEYKFNRNWGAGVLYEDASEAHNGDGVSSTIASIYYHPAGGWRLGLGFGKEKVGGYSSENLTRVGVSYEFHVGGMGIDPSFNIDTVDGESSQVYGVALVWSF